MLTLLWLLDLSSHDLEALFARRVPIRSLPSQACRSGALRTTTSETQVSDRRLDASHKWDAPGLRRRGAPHFEPLGPLTAFRLLFIDDAGRRAEALNSRVMVLISPPLASGGGVQLSFLFVVRAPRRDCCR